MESEAEVLEFWLQQWGRVPGQGCSVSLYGNSELRARLSSEPWMYLISSPQSPPTKGTHH